MNKDEEYEQIALHVLQLVKADIEEHGHLTKSVGYHAQHFIRQLNQEYDIKRVVKRVEELL